KDRRYGRGCWLRRQRCAGTGGYDYRYAAADEIGCKPRQPIKLVLRIPILDGHVLALNIAGLLQAPKKRNGEVLVLIISALTAEIPDHRYRLLCRRRDRPNRRAAEPGDEFPPSKENLHLPLPSPMGALSRQDSMAKPAVPGPGAHPRTRAGEQGREK